MNIVDIDATDIVFRPVKRISYVLMLAMLTIGLFCGNANADTIGDLSSARYSLYNGSTVGNINNVLGGELTGLKSLGITTTYSNYLMGNVTSSEFASVSPTPVPTLNSSAYLDHTLYDFSSDTSLARSTILFDFIVIGEGSYQVPILLDLTARLEGYSPVYDSEYAPGFWVRSGFSSNSPGLHFNVYHGGNGVYSYDVHDVISVYIPTNKVIHMEMYTYANVYREGFASAFLDPVITIDPSFAQHQMFSLYESPGIGNSYDTPPSATPEPASLALMGIGAAGVAFMRRRKMKSAA